MANHFY